MKWGKVLEKFIKGTITGGIGIMLPQIPEIINQSAGPDVKEAGIAALIVGLCNAFLNWYKHRKD